MTTTTLQWLNEHWLHILGPSLLVVVAVVVGLWLRSLMGELLSPSRASTMWRPGEIVLRRLRKSLVTWSLALGVFAAARLSVLSEPVIALINSAVASLVVISLAWFFAGAGVELVLTYEPAVRRFLGRIRAPQPPRALLVNGIRSIAAVITVLLLLEIWRGPDVIGPLSLIAVIVVAGLAIHDASESRAASRPAEATPPLESSPVTEATTPPEAGTRTEVARPSKGCRLAKVILSVIAVVLFADILRRLAFVPGPTGSEQNAALLWIVLEVTGFVWALTLLGGKSRSQSAPILAVVAVAAILIVLVPTLLGVQPVAGYTRSLYSELRSDISHLDWLTGLPESAAIIPTNVLEAVRPAVVVVQGENEQGTGMIIDGDGRVLTCWHVVDGRTAPRVLVPNRSSYDCIVAAFDAATDLAVLVPDHDISTPDRVELGSASDVEPGDELWVIGYALGLQGDASVTKGIVSAVRWMDGVAYIQTDAPMNPGGSGGPIVDSRGRVVGVAAWKIADIQIEGMQFGIAIDHALPLVELSADVP